MTGTDGNKTLGKMCNTSLRGRGPSSNDIKKYNVWLVGRNQVISATLIEFYQNTAGTFPRGRLRIVFSHKK